MAIGPSVRLFVKEPLQEGGVVALEKDQSSYLLSVMRLNEGDKIFLFNGCDGEWIGEIVKRSKKLADLHLIEQARPQSTPQNLHYIFAPLKRARLDYMVQKAVELGVSRLTPVITQHTNVDRVNLDRMRANAIEAAEQCGILSLPQIDSPVKLSAFVDEWLTHESKDKQLVFCDESLTAGGPIADLGTLQGDEIAVLIGPEGGFSQDERDLLVSQRFVKALSLGPRIMRADTAAVAALALVNAVKGDWQNS